MAATATRTAGQSRWNPYQTRRCVRVSEVAPDGIVVFATKSFTSSDAEDKYHPAVDVATGAVLCDCPHFTYRLAKDAPTVASGTVCKHLQRSIANLKRRGAIA